MVVIECRIRGVRNPAYRKEFTSRAAKKQAQGLPPPDDGTRIVKIIGSEYKLSESEILNWIGCV